MTTTEDDLTNALRQLYASTHPGRQPGEFTIEEFAAAQEPPIEREDAEKVLYYEWRHGKIEKPPKRFINGCLRVVYRMKPND